MLPASGRARSEAGVASIRESDSHRIVKVSGISREGWARIALELRNAFMLIRFNACSDPVIYMYILALRSALLKNAPDLFTPPAPAPSPPPSTITPPPPPGSPFPSS